MDYKAYEPNPHSTLSQIKNLLEKEEFYQAWIVCSQYFMGLETNNHIRRALDYAAKDNVYKYLVKSMNEPSKTKQADRTLETYKRAEENLKAQGQSYAVAKAAMEEFCTDNNMDMETLVEQFSQKHKKLSREELIEKNKAINERQADKFAKAIDAVPQPTREELEILTKEAVKFNENLNLQSIERVID